MKTVLRQDGSAVELSDEDAEKWVAMGLATELPMTSAEPPPVPLEPAAWHADAADPENTDERTQS